MGSEMCIRDRSPDDAVTLLRSLTGRPLTGADRIPAENLVHLCGHLPLAVSLLASRLRHHPRWSAADLEARMLATQNRLGQLRVGDRAVAAAFELSYRDLTADRQRFFRCLGLFPGADLDAHIGAAVTGISVSESLFQLDALYDDHLLDESASGRYRMHDLVRDYARALADEETDVDREAAADRVSAYYLAALAEVNQHIGRSGSPSASAPSLGSVPTSATAPIPAAPLFAINSRAAALRWVEDERANLLACIERADSQGQDATVVRFTAAMAVFLRHAGPWDQAVVLHRSAAEAARRIGDEPALAAALAHLGVACRLIADYPTAEQALAEALALQRAAGDSAGTADVLNQLGIVHYLKADYQAAESAQLEALALCEVAGDRLGQANALADLGMDRRATGRYSAAHDDQARALQIYRELGDQYGQANALRDLGIVHCIIGEYATALAEQREALALYRGLDDRLHQAYALNEIGEVHRLTGDLSAARAAHLEALGYYTDLGDAFGRANSTRHLGTLDRLDGDLPAAEQRLGEALAAYKHLGSRGGEAATQVELGLTLHELGGSAGRPSAQEAINWARLTYHDLGDRCGEASALNSLGAVRRTAAPQEALAHHRAALGLAQEITSPLEQARAHEGIARCLAATGDLAEATTALHAARTLYEQLGTADALASLSLLESGLAVPGQA